MVKSPYYGKSRPTYGLKPLAKLSQPLISKSVRNRGALLNQILILWPDIAGDAARWSRPVSISSAKQDKKDTSLKIEIDSGRGPMASMLIPTLINKVNAACGYSAISRISLQQTGYIGKNAPPLHTPAVKPILETKALDDITNHISSPGLRDSLHRLGAALRKR